MQIESLNRAFTLQDALADIRRALGEANTKVGVAKELADYDALSRRQKLIESILTAQSSEMVDFDEMAQLPKQIVSEDRYDRSKGAVRVRMLDTEAVSKLRDEAERLRVRVYALADRISDLNRERLTIDLSEEIAQAAGL
jgi:chaperonin cofactor prefoldin